MYFDTSNIVNSTFSPLITVSKGVLYLTRVSAFNRFSAWGMMMIVRVLHIVRMTAWTFPNPIAIVSFCAHYPAFVSAHGCTVAQRVVCQSCHL